MLCETCTLYGGDGEDNTIRVITGHHPACENFKIDKNYFVESLQYTAQQIADRMLTAEMPKMKAMYEQMYKPKVKKDSVFDEKWIQTKIYKWRFQTHCPIVPNPQFFCGENDIISVTRSGYVHEYEIKISKADFKADFKKTEKHDLLSKCYKNNYKKKFYSGGYPNYFYYATPKGLLSIDDIPEYAGLVEFSTDIYWGEEIKKAPILHKDKISETEKVRLMEKLYYRYWNLRLK